MTRFHPLKKLQESFNAKIFVATALLILIISASFTAYFVSQQNSIRKAALVNEGQLLARMLAYNGTIAIFAENQNLMKDAVDGILQNDDVVRVRIVNYEGKLLRDQSRPATDRPAPPENDDIPLGRVVDYLKRTKEQVYYYRQQTLQFWCPVSSRGGYTTDEKLLFVDSIRQEDHRILGFVNVSLDKKILDRAYNSLLAKSCLMALLCLFIGLLVAYHVAKAISKPLNNLTERVHAIGADGHIAEVPVETNDEIGRLAAAFNDMAASLKNREAEKGVLEQQIRHKHKMEAVGTLAGGIAHDFNNLLTSIIGYGILVQNSLTRKSTLNSYLEQILAAAEKAASLTQRLLVFSRKQAINAKPLNLNQVIVNLHDFLLRLIGQDVELKVDLTQDEVVVKADEGQMDQVVINLVANANDAMPNGGTLTITSGIVELTGNFRTGWKDVKPGMYASMTVSDTGVGINPTMRDRIFDPFFTTKEVGKGPGLGLSIVHGIVQQHNGYVQVDAQDGRTIFTILLPLFEPAVELKKLEKILLPKGKKETILLAEDDRSVRNLARHILNKYGYRVIEATDGADAVAKFRENSDDINMLLLDVIMPKMNGRAVYDEIARMRPGIKTLFISGYPFEVVTGQGILDEGLHFISKPLQPGALLVKLREVLDEEKTSSPPNPFDR